MRILSVGISLMAVSTLMIELSLIRAFDVLFYPNIAYMIITCAVIAFGLAGIFSVLLRPLKAPEAVQSLLTSRGVTVGHRDSNRLLVTFQDRWL